MKKNVRDTQLGLGSPMYETNMTFHSYNIASVIYICKYKRTKNTTDGKQAIHNISMIFPFLNNLTNEQNYSWLLLS